MELVVQSRGAKSSPENQNTATVWLNRQLLLLVLLCFKFLLSGTGGALQLWSYSTFRSLDSNNNLEMGQTSFGNSILASVVMSEASLSCPPREWRERERTPRVQVMVFIPVGCIESSADWGGTDTVVGRNRLCRWLAAEQKQWWWSCQRCCQFWFGKLRRKQAQLSLHVCPLHMWIYDFEGKLKSVSKVIQNKYVNYACKEPQIRFCWTWNWITHLATISDIYN